jgi:hypothetical protein
VPPVAGHEKFLGALARSAGASGQTRPGAGPFSLLRAGGGQDPGGTPRAADDVTRRCVPEIVINRDGPEDRRVAFIDDYGGRIELSTQQLRNLITLFVSDEFRAITGL